MGLSAASLMTSLWALGAVVPFADEMVKVKAAGAVEVLTRARTIRIEGAARLARGWKRAGPCPTARAVGTDLLLSCKTARLHAQREKDTVTVFSLRGLPWVAKDEPAPQFLFAPETVGLGGPCPGTTAAGAGECALMAGKVNTAREHFTTALQTAHRDFAALRLADLALRDDNPLEAMEWLERGGRSGEWGRLASVRQCELSGRCFKGQQRDALFDAAGLREPLKVELLLRELRMLRFESPAAAVEKLFALGEGGWPDVTCARAPAICQNVLRDALASADPEARIMALTLFAAGPVTQAGPERPSLARAASDAALAQGAPHYAAAALAAATADVSREELWAHLRRLIYLYELSGESARANTIRAYALDAGLRVPKAKRGRPTATSNDTPALWAATESLAIREAELATALANATVARARAKGNR